MAIMDLFSKRQKRLRGEVPDIYTYDIIPDKVRVQIVYIIQDAIGKRRSDYSDKPQEMYKYIFDVLCREYGKFTLCKNFYASEYQKQVINFLLQTNSLDEVLDIYIRDNYNNYTTQTAVKTSPDEAILELNERFKESGIGYSFEGNQIIRVDSTYIHSEITKPTLALLSNSRFEGANEEYLKAHEHYRHGRNKECLAECLKAFESTLKIICKEKKWEYNQTDTAKKLIQICFKNELIPTFTQNQFTSLQNLLESGIPTVRNKLGGHGQGQIPQEVDDGITRYGLNLTGTNIIFLLEQSGII